MVERHNYNNFPEGNNYSTLYNDEMSTLNDFSGSEFTSTNNSYHQNNKINNYNYSKTQPYSSTSITDMYSSQETSSAQIDARESLKQYIDQLTAHLYKYDPESLLHLENKLNKIKNGEISVDDVGRTTPLVFTETHSLVKLDFPGLLYQLQPNTLSQTGGTIRVTDEIFPRYFQLNIEDNPGPLSLDSTTEEQIFYYLKEQMAIELQDKSSVEYDSVQLLINYLELLIKENGKPRMSNIVRLLNDGISSKTYNSTKESKTYDSISRNSISLASSRATSRASSRAPSPEPKETNMEPQLPQNSLDKPQGPESVSSIMRSALNNVSNDQKLYQNMDRYREYIWSGRFEEAINFAMRAGLWDHAFALALRMDNSALVNEILVRFSRRAIYDSDPLSTMHELMAARLPRIVVSNRTFSNSEMGDWRSHLSMILAVKRFKPEKCRQAIESMGEKLLLLRSYFAAHLCFLLADTPFGHGKKLDLIGWSPSPGSGLEHWRSAPEQAIRLTEVYERALRLRDDGSHRALSVHLLPYKHMMAFRALSLQQLRAAYEYCRDIGEVLGLSGVDWLRCGAVTFEAVSSLRMLARRLHILLHREDLEDDVDPHEGGPAWIGNIEAVYCAFCGSLGVWNPRTYAKPAFQLAAQIQQPQQSYQEQTNPQQRFREQNQLQQSFQGKQQFQDESNFKHSFQEQHQSQRFQEQHQSQQRFQEQANHQQRLQEQSSLQPQYIEQQQPYQRKQPSQPRHQDQPQLQQTHQGKQHSQQQNQHPQTPYQGKQLSQQNQLPRTSDQGKQTLQQHQEQPLYQGKLLSQQQHQIPQKPDQGKQDSQQQQEEPRHEQPYLNKQQSQQKIQQRFQEQQDLQYRNQDQKPPQQSYQEQLQSHQSYGGYQQPQQHYQSQTNSQQQFTEPIQSQQLYRKDSRTTELQYHEPQQPPQRYSDQFQSQQPAYPEQPQSQQRYHEPTNPQQRYQEQQQSQQQYPDQLPSRNGEPLLGNLLARVPPPPLALPPEAVMAPPSRRTGIRTVSGCSFVPEEPRHQDYMSNSPNGPQQAMFVPAVDRDWRGSSESVDVFAVSPPTPGRSRTVSNCSAGSGRSRRNSTESKEMPRGSATGRQPLEATAEERDSVISPMATTTAPSSLGTAEDDKKSSSWNPLSWFSSSKVGTASAPQMLVCPPGPAAPSPALAGTYRQAPPVATWQPPSTSSGLGYRGDGNYQYGNHGYQDGYNHVSNQ